MRAGLPLNISQNFSKFLKSLWKDKHFISQVDETIFGSTKIKSDIYVPKCWVEFWLFLVMKLSTSEPRAKLSSIYLLFGLTHYIPQCTMPLADGLEGSTQKRLHAKIYYSPQSKISISLRLVQNACRNWAIALELTPRGPKHAQEPKKGSDLSQPKLSQLSTWAHKCHWSVTVTCFLTKQWTVS